MRARHTLAALAALPRLLLGMRARHKLAALAALGLALLGGWLALRDSSLFSVDQVRVVGLSRGALPAVSDKLLAAARAAPAGSRAPPPQRNPSPSGSIRASSRSSLSTSPRTPASATSRFDPEPTTCTSSRRRRAQSSSSTSSRREPARAKRSAAPPVRTVVSRASG